MATATRKRGGAVGSGGRGGEHPWKTKSFELLKRSVEAAVVKIPQMMDFYIEQAVTSTPTPTAASSAAVFSSSSSSPNSRFPPPPTLPQPPPPTPPNPPPPMQIMMTPETILADIVWLGKVLTNLLTVAEMQKPSAHESDHTKRTAFESFMGLIGHLNGVVQRLYMNYIDSADTITGLIKSKKLVKENPELVNESRIFEIGELARRSSMKMTASSIYLLISQLHRALNENPNMHEWLFSYEMPSAFSSLGGGGGGGTCGGGGYSSSYLGGGTVYY